MSAIQSICVFCGSSSGVNPAHKQAGEALADVMHAKNLSLVYGGAHIGIMGAVANRLLGLGGKVYGVIPKALVDLEVAHEGLTQLYVVDDMHERKAKMAELSDGFISLAGGLGTLEEMFEVLTWAQLSFHSKPCGLFNVAGFYDHLLVFLDHAAAEGFMKPQHRELLLTDTSAEALLNKMLQYQAVYTPKRSE